MEVEERRLFEAQERILLAGERILSSSLHYKQVERAETPSTDAGSPEARSRSISFETEVESAVAPLHELLDLVGASGRRQVDEQNPFSRAVEPPEAQSPKMLARPIRRRRPAKTMPLRWTSNLDHIQEDEEGRFTASEQSPKSCRAQSRSGAADKLDVENSVVSYVRLLTTAHEPVSPRFQRRRPLAMALPGQ